ncbi:DarT ssDNA thymidine ADP-ribosyltransferase family protein [Pseudolysinimonas sp.]|uniref:DarT ssDNA thymidine ADP-ribosyltransferase family protein n=1 Tax=Pseudolysinimonas sp. TaxID=2680009 RepID=UPI003F8033B6
MAECIHGLDEGLCDICYPRTVAAPRSTPRAAATRPPRAAAPSRARSAPQTQAAPSVLLSAQRIYHVTHVANLEMVAIDGALRADATPEVDLSSKLAREMRRSAPLASGGTVADRVAFYLSPEADRWREVRDGAAGTHWSDAARAANPTEFVVLVADAKSAGGDVVLADGDAAAPATRFAHGIEQGTQQLRRMRSLDPAYAAAELLAPNPFPFTGIALIGVPHEPMRDRVRAILREVGGHAPKVAVYPPWFQRG